MKKIYVICSLVLIAATMTAQIALWRSYPEKISDENGESKDTIFSDVVGLYPYDNVDSITIQSSKYNYRLVNVFCLWKDGSIINPISDKGMYIVNDVAAQNLKKYDNSYFRNNSCIDSIVWHPYPLLNVYIPTNDTIPVETLYGEIGTRIYPISPEPMHATFSYSYTNSDSTIANVVVERNNTQENGQYMMSMTVTPIKPGKTTISFTFNGKIQKNFELVVTPRPNVQDETILTLDSLFKKIYSRLVLTGDVLPYGQGDLKNTDEGFASLYRGMFSLQELGADMLCWIWRDPEVWSLIQNNWDSKNVMSEGLFRRLYYNIWLCNSYLNRAEGQNLLATKCAEVRFLRAYFYYYLLDLYGNVPIIIDNTKFFSTPQSNRTQLYQFVETELIAAEKDMIAPGYKTDYYRLDKAAAWLLLSRLYLNGAVYAAVDDYSKAAQYASKVIKSSYDLASNYKWLFMGDNDQRSKVNDAWKEIIFPIRHEGEATASYCGANYLIGSMSDSDMPPTGIITSWKCIRSRAQLPRLFFDDPKSAVKGTADVIAVAAKDDRALFCNYYNGQEWGYNTNSLDFFYGGWGIQKWTNLMVDGAYVQSDSIWVDTDIPLMRKAEAYLNYAEAILRGGNTVDGLSALEAVNVIRQRANATLITSLVLDDILDERGREFYAEGCRRSDLIRFRKFGGNTGYQWELKGGSNRDFPAYMNLYPIPDKFMNMMYQAVQNEGY